MAGVIATLKRLYTENGAPVKHLCWLVLAGIGAILSMQPDTNASSNTNFIGILAGAAISMIYSLVLAIYSFGYNCIIMHNRFEEDGKPSGLCIMPEFDLLPFKIFGRAIILLIVWGIWTIVLCLPIIIPIIGLIFCLAITPFVGFVQVAYSKEFKTEGIFSIAILAKFMRLFWLDAVWWWFKIFIFGLISCAILFILGNLLGLFDIATIMTTGQMPQATNIIWILMQYISIVLGFVNAYGMADIFARKWDNSSY